MKKNGNIVRYSVAELVQLRGGPGRIGSDLDRVRAITEEELEASIASDPDFRDIPRDWYLNAKTVMPPAKTALSIRLDADIVAWFREQGPGYQTRINAVLRSFVEHATKQRA